MAREFWIHPVPIGHSVTGAKLFKCSDSYRWFIHEEPPIHVVEASELTKLQEKCREYEDFLRQSCGGDYVTEEGQHWCEVCQLLERFGVK